MPELPEVEVTRRHIAPHLKGVRIEAVTLGSPRVSRRNNRPVDIIHRLVGRRVENVGRHGKFIIIDMEDDLAWVMHLGMSGRMTVAAPDEPLDKHTHFRGVTDRNEELRFVDPRTFGFVAVFTPDELDESSLSRLGRDAWSDLPDPEELAAMLENRTAPIKSLLLDQRIIAGLGNIYADEILFRAGVHPSREGGSITVSELTLLHEAIPLVLGAAIDNNGTSLDDLAYLLPDGRAGEMLDELIVYGADGTPCPRCGTEIERRVLRGRSIHFCPECQT
ncbi:MAG: bifunctional DNA-formamidopyrimidine glycosylase/DNA-(apurinic or apyrimidinic site) lyase [Acidimicrobiia bacterium]|nr:bifunctional DNA-formamidopyrimidine glycosylase/DNA-(apurinic or apyrimidinic site) lyase [Acidimicrobiia bacterium]